MPIPRMNESKSTQSGTFSAYSKDSFDHSTLAVFLPIGERFAFATARRQRLDQLG